MWGLFSRDPLKDFAYEVGERVSGFDGKSIWSLHSGKKKVTNFTYFIVLHEVLCISGNGRLGFGIRF